MSEKKKSRDDIIVSEKEKNLAKFGEAKQKKEYHESELNKRDWVIYAASLCVFFILVYAFSKRHVIKSTLRKPIEITSLQFRGVNGWCEKNSEKGYSGRVYEKYPNGNYKMRCTLKDGVENGLYLAWYENGQRSMSISTINGKYDGELIMYHVNGNKAFEAILTKNEIKQDTVPKFWDLAGRRVFEKEDMIKIDDKLIKYQKDTFPHLMKTVERVWLD